MRVLLYAGVDLSRPGGVETHVRELATHLARRGHDVDVHGRPERLEGFKMVGRVDPDRYDVLHHHGGAWPARLAGRTPYVKTLHFCVAAKMEVYVRMARMRTLFHPGNWAAVSEERAAVRRQGHFVPVSTRVMEEFERWHGLDPATATVIPNGVNPNAPHANPHALREALGIPNDTVVLLTIGRADFVKGYGLLGTAWERVRTELAKPAVWVTAGGAASQRKDGRVVTGPVTHAEVLGWIHAADVGALPSFYEGNSVALLEMLQGGLYVLAHDVGAARDVIRNPSSGTLVEPTARAWETALRSALEGDAASTRSPQLDPSHHWSSIAERIEAVYTGLGRA